MEALQPHFPMSPRSEFVIQVDLINEEFEAAWRSGRPPHIEDYLPRVAEEYRPALLSQLLVIEIQLRAEAGLESTSTDYLGRFPTHASLIRLALSSAQFESTEEFPSSKRSLPASDHHTPQLTNYEILDELGQGGMGVVYRAYDRRRDGLVALKTIRTSDPSLLYWLKHEFRSLAGIVHPNLVNLYELISDGRDWFLVMEYVDGVGFLEHLRSGHAPPNDPLKTSRSSPAGSGEHGDGKPGAEDAGEIDGIRQSATEHGPGRTWDLSAMRLARLRAALGQLACGVQALHEAGRLHRDIKPSNVLVTRTGRVVLLDFGLAAELGPTGLHESSEHQILGTAAYMAPEQAAGEPVSPASDWYSVGTMLYQALTGQLPFRGRPLDMLMNKQRSEPPPPSTHVPGIPEDLDALCIELLSRDPAARPSGASILQRLRVDSREAGAGRSPAEPTRHVEPLAGRTRQLEALAEALQDVRRGQTAMRLVRGGSGVGKTTLVHRFLDCLSGRDDVVILSGRCREQEWIPYKAVDGLVDSLSRYLNRLSESEARELLPRDVSSLTQVFPVLLRVGAVTGAPGRAVAVSDPGEMRRRAFAALRELLARIGDRRSLVLFIDDMQWGDLDSAALLAEILRPPDPPVLLLLGSYRGEDAATSPFLGELLGRDGTVLGVGGTVLDLEPLTPGEAEELALDLLGRGAPDATACARLVARESRGNPLFVHELVRHVGRADRPLTAVSGILDDVLWSRIERLPEGAQRLLGVVAVSGRPLVWLDASEAAGVDADRLAILNVLTSGRLVRGTGPREEERIEVYHDRIREVVVARLTPEVVKEHHRRLALRLEATGHADVEVLAVHFHEGGESERAGVYYAAAADRASESLAFDRAATLYGLALALRPAGSSDEYRLRARLGDALANARRGREAGQVYLDASPGVSRLESIDLRRRAFQQLLTAGDHDRGVAVLRQVFHDVGLRYPKTPARALASTILGVLRLRVRGVGFRPRPPGLIDEEDLLRLDVGWSAGMGLCLIDTTRAAPIIIDNLFRSLRAGDEFHATQAMLAVAGFVAVGGRAGFGMSRRLMAAAERWKARTEDPTLDALHCMVKGLVAYCQGDWADSLAWNDRGAAIFRERCTGVATSLDISAYFSLLSLFWLGEVEELRRRRRALLGEAEQRQDLFSMTNYRTEVMAYDLLADDDPDGAAAEAEDAIHRWSPLGFHAQHLYALIANVRADLYRGMGAEARGRIGAAWPAYRRSGLHHSSIARINVDQLIACSALASRAEDRARGARLLREAEAAATRLDRERLRFASALAAMFRGRLAALRGDPRRAAASYRHAAEVFAALRMPLYEAATRCRLGELLPGLEGEDCTRGAIAALASRQVRNPPSLVCMILP